MAGLYVLWARNAEFFWVRSLPTFFEFLKVISYEIATCNHRKY